MLWRQKWDKHAAEAFELASETIAWDYTWLVGNEPMVEGQATASPTEAADLGKRWRRDLPEVMFACPGVYINFWTRTQVWLNSYLDAGGPVPDFWHIHNYAWSHEGAQHANEQFFAWMDYHNVTRPVIISETSRWNDETWEKQTSFMDWTVDALQGDNPVVATAWFAAWYKFWPTRLLLEQNFVTRSKLGDYFRQIVDGGVSVTYNGG
jgi:hypothetical protein